MTKIAKIATTKPGLAVLDIALQALTVLMLVAAIVAVQTRTPCYIYLVGAPLFSIALWAGAGLIIDRQALRGAIVAAPAKQG